MRWQIEQFIFCEREQTLTHQAKVSQLEPIAVELLAYFCRHTDQILSREVLIEQVWLGRVITDNAVSKVITKLRKLLNDDAKKPKFIATFPKKGYKFIANVSEVSEEQESITPLTKVESPNDFLKNSHRNSYGLYSLTAVIILILWLVSYWTINRVEPPITQVKALTRDSGRESRPQMSPDNQYLAYVEVRDKKMHQWIKSIADQTRIEISHGKESTVWVDSLSWNSDGSKFVYLVTTPVSCRYFIRSFDQMELGEAQLIHNCPAGSYGKIAYTHDDNRLIYSENSGRNTPFTLFEMNLLTQAKRKVNQPEIFLGGNSQFDLHPFENKLLISSPNEQQWEGFYSLDLATDELTLLFSQDAYICCGRWSHDGKRVVLMGEHPATELVSFDLNGENRQVVYSGSEQVSIPERHNNGKDYLFPLVKLNQNASYYSFANTSNNEIAYSSVDDSLAVFAHNNEQIAYVSVSSGSEEIWLTETSGKLNKKLTHFNDNRHYVDLLWSYNGDYLLALALNEIHLIDLDTGLSKSLKIPQVEIRAVSWKDDNTIAYSTQSNNSWRVYYYNILTDKVMPEKESYRYIRYSKNPDNVLWLNKTGDLLVGNAKRKVLDEELLSAGLVNGRQFNLKKMGVNWAWQTRVKGKYQLMLKDELLEPAKKLLLTDSYHFDLSHSGVLYHTLESLNSDIYQTVSE